MTTNLKLLNNFVWKFFGTVRFGNDHVAAILDFGDLQWGNILITRVYFIKGLRNNLFSIGQFCDSDLEVAFRRNTCFVRNIECVDFLKGNRTTNLYTINLYEMASASPVFLMAHATSTKTTQQNGFVEQRNQTLVEAARTMLICSRAPLFLWAEVIATMCYTQNRSIIHRRFNKTPYELINERKPDISFLHVFGALCYPKNDREDIGKLGAKGLDLTYALSTITTQQLTEGELDLLFEAMYDDYIGGHPSATPRTVSAAQAHQDVDGLKTQQQHAQQLGNQAPLQPKTVADNVLNAMFNANTFVNPFATPSTSVTGSSSSQYVDPSNMHTFYQPYPHKFQ
nr:retrovirus-related Pol polyprotein from transposon TNT 1-94 [Tanacetum cinerariifolium]